MNNNYIIKNAYSTFDKKMENLYEKKANINSWREVSKGSDINRPVMEFLDKNNKVLFKAEYEILSILYPFDNDFLCVWAWAHPQIDKNKTLLSRELLKYGLDITNKDDYTSMFIKSLLTNSRLKLSNTEVELLQAISLYITKKEGIFEFSIPGDKIEYSYLVLLTKIF